MTFHIRVRSVVCACLLAAGCTSGQGTGSKLDLGTGTGGAGDNGGGDNGDNGGNGGGDTQSLLTVTDLASDQAGEAQTLSTSLVNAWGLVAYQGMFWVANQATGKVSIFDGAGMPSTSPASDSIDLGEGITGVAINDSNAMQVENQNTCGPAKLIFANLHGQLIGVNTDIKPTGGTTLVDRTDVEASYLGVATARITADTVCRGACDPGSGSGSGDGSGSGSGSGSDDGSGGGSGSGSDSGSGHMPSPGTLVLAADFHNARIDVFDESFQLVQAPMFANPTGLPAGFAPFNVMVWNDVVYVAYAQQDEDKEEELKGPGLGFVAAFDVCGNLMWTAKGDELNAPWGMTLGDMPGFEGALLVGNFGDGHITALNPADGNILGQLQQAPGTPVAIDGLWGIAFGKGVQNAQAGGLYFAAGPADEMHGMFGVINETPSVQPPPTM